MWVSVRRHPLMSVASISNVGVSLCILGTFALAIANIDCWRSELISGGRVTVFLAAKADREAVKREIWAQAGPYITDIEFLSRDQLLEEARSIYGSSLEALPENPLPDAFVIQTKDPEQDLVVVARILPRVNGVGDIEYGGRAMRRLLAVSRAIKGSGIAMAALLFFAAFLIIHGTIRLTVHARRREIRIMQLVGATDWFIRIPFLLEGAFYGLVGGALSALALWVAYYHLHEYMERNLRYVPTVYSTSFFANFAAGVLLAGAAFGALASILSVRRYLTEA
jgi:cell division transport system permease protein